MAEVQVHASYAEEESELFERVPAKVPAVVRIMLICMPKRKSQEKAMLGLCQGYKKEKAKMHR